MPPLEQLIMGLTAGFVLCGLLRWTPLWRDLLAAIAATVLIDLGINEQSRRLDLPSLAAKLPEEVLSYPHFCLGITLAVASVLAVLHVLRAR